MGCDIHVYIERLVGTPVQFLPAFHEKRARLVADSAWDLSAPDHERPDLTRDEWAFAKQHGLTFKRAESIRADRVVREGLAGSPWEMVAPKRDFRRWPKKKRDELADWQWGPGDSMRWGKCDGVYDRELDTEGPCVGKGNAKRGIPECPACAGTGHRVDWYHERSYVTFGSLAGVRYDEFPPIAEPRGVPGDIDLRTLRASSWDHTPSWLTLAEVLAHDWDPVCEKHTQWGPQTFLEFVEVMAEPLVVSDEYTQIKTVLADLVEGETGRKGGRVWLTEPVTKNASDARAMRERALTIAGTIRFVFGFDS